MTSLVDSLERIGAARFGILLVLLPLTLFYFGAGLYVISGHDPLGILGDSTPQGDDFVTFWSASALALNGTPELAYDPGVFREFERTVTGPLTPFTPWHYPPTFMLAMLPMALMPYQVVLFYWLLLPLFCLLWVMSRLFESQVYAWTLPIFPYVVICEVSGQNGILNAILIGSVLLTLDRRPIVAGIFAGLLTWKPHLAALVFIALIAGRHWRALGSAVAAAVALAVASAVVLGLAPWYAFVNNLGFVTSLLDSRSMPWERMPSVYVTARLVGLDIASARIVQVAAALAAIAIVCLIWYRGAPLRWRGAALAAAMPLMTPYVFDYDLVLLIFPVAWLLDACLREGWRTGDTAVLIAVWIGAAFSWPIIKAGGPPFLPLVFALLLVAIWRRAFPSPAFVPVPAPRPV